MKIGYQGIEGSNSEAAAREMALGLGWEEAEYVPLVHSYAVVAAMQSSQVDCGVMATLNHVAGIVVETAEALQGVEYEVLAETCLAIHHCLFVKDPAIRDPAVIASHPQALRQCAGHLTEAYPAAEQMEVEDTAIGARYLADGTLPETAGVLCRRNAGEAFGLHLLAENLEDDPTNATEFELVALKKSC